MKLQIGCSEVNGRYKQAEWINLDITKQDEMGPTDVVADASKNLPFPANTFDEIHCIHVLEHVTRDKYSKMLLEMYQVLKPGGVCYVETPDFKGVINNLVGAFNSGNVKAIHIWTTSIYGKNEREGMAHYWGFYEGLLRREMKHQGFKEVERLIDQKDMVSQHYKQEPILLIKGMK